MATNMQEKRKTWYFDPRHGWIEQETPDAKYRLTTIARTLTDNTTENKMHVVDPRGGWLDVSSEDEHRLPAVERGFIFTVKPRQGDRQSFLEISCKRYFDKEMITSILDGLELYDQKLTPLAAPELAIDCVCIPRTQQEIFYERVSARAGKIIEAQADLKGMYDALTKLSALCNELEQLCQISRSVIDKIAEGIQTEAPAISERSKTAHHIRDQGVEIVEHIRSEKLTLDNHPGQVEHKAYGAAYLTNAEEWLKQVEKLHREHKSYEIQAVSRIQETLSQSLPRADSPAYTRRYLLMPVVEYYTELGHDCRLTEDGMILRLEDAVLELSDKPHVKTSNSSSGNELNLGKQTAERGGRQL